jgi:hypothetical protein
MAEESTGENWLNFRVDRASQEAQQAKSALGRFTNATALLLAL